MSLHIADINECLQPDKYICNGICQNTFGSYTCTHCPHGTDFNANTRKCRPATIILGRLFVYAFFLKKVQFTPSNYYKNSIFSFQLQNRTTKAIQLLEPDKFGPLGGFEVVFHFVRI